MSPPTSPALSAGPPGGSTFLNVAPPSVVPKLSTPKYDLFRVMPAKGGRPMFFLIALINPPTAKKATSTIQIQALPVKPRRRRRLYASRGELVASFSYQETRYHGSRGAKASLPYDRASDKGEFTNAS